VRSFRVICCDGKNDSGSTEISLHEGGRTGSRPGLLGVGGGTLSRGTSGGDPSGANGSRQCSMSRHLEFVLKLFPVSDSDLRTGAKSSNNSRLNLGETLNNGRGPPHGQGNHTEQSNSRVKGTYLRDIRRPFSDAESTPDFVGGPQGSRERKAESHSEKTLGEYTNPTCLRFNPSKRFLTDRRSLNS
jgi:hypothetical protein